ncbi:MAG: hypothetical protein ACKORB_06220 [Opitutia bacterium]
MTTVEFESLVVRYVDGSASSGDMEFLRGFVSASPSNRDLFRARVRLRRAQRGQATRGAVEAALRSGPQVSLTEFDQLTYAYLDGAATQGQMARLRDAIASSEEFRSRFQSRSRLHAAQTAYLKSKQRAGVAQALRSLSAFAHRFGRASAHLCLLLLVFVELRVRVPAEYSGFMFYVESAVGQVIEPDFPLTVSPDDSDEAFTSDIFDGILPPMPMPAPSLMPEAGLDEVLEPGANEA